MRVYLVEGCLGSRRLAKEAVDYEQLSSERFMMVDPKEQKLAKVTLDTKDVEFSVWYLLQKNFRGYLIMAVIFSPGLIFLYYTDQFLLFHLYLACHSDTS